MDHTGLNFYELIQTSRLETVGRAMVDIDGLCPRTRVMVDDEPASSYAPTCIEADPATAHVRTVPETLRALLVPAGMPTLRVAA